MVGTNYFQFWGEIKLLVIHFLTICKITSFLGITVFSIQVNGDLRKWQ